MHFSCFSFSFLFSTVVEIMFNIGKTCFLQLWHLGLTFVKHWFQSEEMKKSRYELGVLPIWIL